VIASANSDDNVESDEY
jgi:hypothetical protein